jgi:hypothetical protein
MGPCKNPILPYQEKESQAQANPKFEWRFVIWKFLRNKELGDAHNAMDKA